MATFVPNGEVIDKTADLVNDANRNHLINMENITHDNLLNEPQWRTKQMLTYQNLIQTTNPVDLGYFLRPKEKPPQATLASVLALSASLRSVIATQVPADA